MSPRVQGTLGAQDQADMYTIWRKPGQHRFELEIRGEGAATLVLETSRSGETLNPAAAAWRAIEERLAVRAGSRISGVVTVPEVPLDGSSNLEWVQLRVRIIRAVPVKSVEYDFYLAPGEPAPSPSPPSPA